MTDLPSNPEPALRDSNEEVGDHDKTLESFQISPHIEDPVSFRGGSTQRSSFDPVPSRSIADTKYAPEGRFGFDPLELSANVKLKKPTLNHEQQIPRTDTFRKMSSDEDASESGKSRYKLFGLNDLIY